MWPDGPSVAARAEERDGPAPPGLPEEVRGKSMGRVASWLARRHAAAPSWPPRRGLPRPLVAGALLALTLGLYFAGALERIETFLMGQRFALLERPATGELVIAQIDARSLRETGIWPWPRQIYASILDRAFAAGAAEVAFDIDFSAASTPEGDALLASALERYGGRVVLPVFRQPDSPGDPQAEMVDVRPLAAFGVRTALGSVNVRPDPDGVVRRYPVGDRVDGRFEPSVAALLAGTGRFDLGSFYIDFGIRPGSVPRISVTDLLQGRIAPERLAGRRILVGATALELGDFLTVPAHGVMSGVTTLALATESLLQERAIQRTGWPVTLALCLLVAGLFVFRFGRLSWRWATAAAAASRAAALAAGLGLQALAPVSLDVAAPLLLVGLSYGARSVREIEAQALLLFRQRMAGLYRRALMAKVVEDSFDGIVIADEQGHIEVFNPAAQQILGIAASDAVGRPVLAVLPELAGLLAAEPGGEPPDEIRSHRELSLTDAKGRQRILEVQAGISRLKLSRHPRERRTRVRSLHVYTFRDVTERMEAQAAAERAATEAELANRAKTEFLANMSHELRTPLNAIIGFSEVIAKGLMGPVEPAIYKTYAEHIHASGGHLLDVVSEVLDVAKIEAGRMEVQWEKVDLDDLIRSCTEMVRGSHPVGEGPRIRIEVEPDLPAVEVDKRLMRQILINLLSNAVKFTPDEGDVRIAARRLANGRPAVEVRDTGIGIPAHMLQEVTKPFVQVESAYARSHGGSGLGLYLASRFAALQGARLEIESELGGGTTVRVVLPPGRQAQADRDPAQPPPSLVDG
jgi:PAS domain S-box-containing protein